MDLHKLVHKGLDYMPDPIIGATYGAAGGAVVGTVATGAALHGAGLTISGIVVTASTIGAGATASAIGAFAAPIVLPAIGCCAVYGAGKGLINWASKKIG
jgi:hypothetical protein